jgi:hypothetical protein
MRTIGAVVLLSILGACAQLTPAAPDFRTDWDRTLYNARRDADAGNYFAANKVLDEFTRTHTDTSEAREIAFWKAAYMIDPANAQSSLTAGIAALDGYLAASDSSGWYRDEALVLRRTAASAQALASAQPVTVRSESSSPSTRDTVVVVSKSREEEIASLRDQLAKSKDELAKVSAELERIKKRLANPNK